MRATIALRQLERANTVGFIGLGAMGRHMFNNLVIRSLASGDENVKSFVICDVNKQAVSEIISEHKARNRRIRLEAASDPFEVGTKASTIISMVPTSKHVREVYLGSRGVLPALKELNESEIRQTLCLDESTIEQAESVSVAAELKRTGAEMLDAPVSGGVVGARAGTLTIMVGGSREGYARAQPILEFMAGKVVYCGSAGTGLAAKIANNLILGISMLGVSEAMLLGKRLGLDSQVLADIVNTSTGRCWSSEVNNPVPEVNVEGKSPPAKREYQGGFVTKLAHKDLALAVSAAKAIGTPLALGELTELIYRPRAQADSKWNDRDFSSIYAALEEQTSQIRA